MTKPEIQKAREALRKLDQLVAMYFDDESLLFVDAEESEITLSGAVGTQPGEITAARFAAALRQMEGRPTTLLLNSPGGGVDQAVEMFNAIESHGQVEIVVTSLAASAASYLLQAGRKRLIYENSMVMVHAPWTVTVGDAEAHRKEAKILDKYGDRLISAYASRSGKTKDEIREILKGELWMTGQEIIDQGFADAFVTKQDSRSGNQPWDLKAALRKVDQTIEDTRQFIAARSRTAIAKTKIAKMKIALELAGLGRR